MPVLYLVGTPIGNLEDVTFRALRILKEVGLVAAEDTRRARVLLKRYDIATPLTSYHEQGRARKIDWLLRQLAEKDVALISEAGMPLVSDPGYELVRAAIAQGFTVDVIPGPSAITAALAISGLPSDQFVYLGFLPRLSSQRRRFLGFIASDPRTLLCLEAPHRLRAALEDMAQALGDRPVAVCREMTKLHQEVFRGTLREAAAHFQQPRGEFVIVVGGAAPVGAAGAATEEEAASRLLALKRQGARAREAVAQVSAETGLPRRAVYRQWLSLEDEGG